MNRTMLRILLVPILFSALAIDSMASEYANEIRRLCTTERKRPPRGELGRAIRDADRYFLSNPPARRDRQRATAHLNEIVRHTSYSWILQCPAKLKDVGYSFEIDYEAAGNWHVRHNKDKKVVTLGMSMREDASGSILTYIHEMLHVCQFPRETNTEYREGFWEKLRQISSISEKNRYLSRITRLQYQNGLADEVEAFHSMTMSFRELVRASPATCGGKSSWAGATYQWFEVWEGNERQLESGIFAQEKLRGYTSDPSYRYVDGHEHIFEDDQPEVPYFVEVTREQFALKPFHGELRKLIEERGVAVNDRPWDFRRHHAAFDIQVILRETGDYTGKLDNKWGPGSRKALDAFASRTGACLPGREPNMELWTALEVALTDPEASCAPGPRVADAPDPDPDRAPDSAAETPDPTPDGVADLGAMLDAICVAGRLEPRTIGSLVETWTRDNAFELVKHYPPKDTDATRQESWDMKKGDRAFAAAFMELAEEDGPKKACRVMGFDLDPAGVRDHVAARYGFEQAAVDDADETLVASWTAALDGYADAMTIRIRKIGPVVDVWFRE